MAKATPAQWNTAISNFRLMAARHLASAATFPEGDWRRNADIRVAAQANAKADTLEKMQAALAAPTLAVTATIN